MATVEETATDVLSALEASAEYPVPLHLAAKWIGRRYQKLVSQQRWRHRRQLGALTLPAAISGGGLTATRGSLAVTADATAQTAIGATAIAGRHVRINTVWYEIATYVAPTITLSAAFGELDVVAHPFIILPRYQLLPATTRQLGKFVFMRRRREIVARSVASFDMAAPERVLLGDGPTMYAEAGRKASTGELRVELYPYSRTSELIYFTYWDQPALLTLGDDLPAPIDPHVLIEGALIDAFRFRMSQAANKGKVEEAGFWRNEYRAQETAWQRAIVDAAKSDRPVDDISFILHTTGLSASGVTGDDIKTAYDQLFATGSRP